MRWLTDNGLEAQGFKTEYGDEDEADGDATGKPAVEPVAAAGGDAAPEESDAAADAPAEEVGESPIADLAAATAATGSGPRGPAI